MNNQNNKSGIIDKGFDFVFHNFDEMRDFIDETKKMYEDYDEKISYEHYYELQRAYATTQYDIIDNRIFEKEYWFQNNFRKYIWFSTFIYQYSIFDFNINRIFRLYCKENHITIPRKSLSSFDIISELSKRIKGNILDKESKDY